MRSSTCRQLLSLIAKATVTTQPTCFERHRGVIPPAVALLSIMCLSSLGQHTGYEGLMSAMFTSLGGVLGWTDSPAASSFCRARQKVTEVMFEAFRVEVFRLAGPTLRTFQPKVKGFRVVAVDGSWMSVPRSEPLRRLLGIHHIGPKRCPMGKPQVLLVVLTDAITRMPIARVILPGTGSEREAACALLKHLDKGDILVADRGYNGRDMLAAIDATGCSYVLRIPGGVGTWREFRGLQRRRCRDAKVAIVGLKKPLTVRHLRVSGGPGRPRRGSKRETMYLITNLTKQWTAKTIATVYRTRWGIETMFRELKCTLETNRIRARTLEGITQELDARGLHLAIAAFLDMATVNDHQRPGQMPFSSRQTNRTTLLCLLAMALLATDDDALLDRCAIAVSSAARRAQRKRPGRWTPRKPAMFVKNGKKRRT